MLSKILIAVSDDNFRAEAFADYIASCNESYANLIACLNDMITDDFAKAETRSDDDPIIPSWTPLNIDQDVQTYVTGKLSEYGLSGNTTISLPSGYANLNEVATAIVTQVYKDGTINDPDGPDALDNNLQLLHDNLGTRLSTTKTSINEVLSDIREQFHSSTVLEAAAKSCVYSDVVTRLTVYKELVAEKFQNVYSDVSNSYNYFKSILSDKGSTVQNTMETIFNSMGMKHLAEDNNAALNQADVYQYAGVNPIATLDFSTAKNALAATGKVIAGAVYGIGKFVANIGKKVFNWCRNKVEGIIVNPWDIEVINSESHSYTIDGWAAMFNTADGSSYEGPDNQPSIDWTDFDYSSSVINAVYSWFESNASHWYKFDFIFAELLFRVLPTNTSTETQFDFNVECQFKLKPLNYENVIPQLINAGVLDAYASGVNGQFHNADCMWSICGANGTDQHIATIQDYIDWCDMLANLYNSTDLYVEVKDNNEKEMYAAYCFSATLMRWVLSIAEAEILIPTNYDPTSLIPNELYVVLGPQGVNDWFTVFQGGDQPLNSDFLSVASGYSWVNDNFTCKSICTRRAQDPQVYHPLHAFKADYICDAIAKQFIFQRCERELTPINYPFLPYRNNNSGFTASRFGLVTDSEHQDVMTKFLTAIVAIVIVVVLGVTATVVIKKLARKRWWKMTQFIGKSDNAMWNGQVLSKKDKRKYIRYQRRLGVSNLLTKGIQEVSSDVVNADSITDKLNVDSINTVDNVMGTNFSDVFTHFDTVTDVKVDESNTGIGQLKTLITG